MMILLLKVVFMIVIFYIPIIIERKNNVHPHSGTVFTLTAIWIFLFQAAIHLL